MNLVKVLAAISISAASASTFTVDAYERGFIRKGMKESEVVYRIGLPDHETFIKNLKGHPEEKAWSYFPDPRDPQTLTIITLRAGVVAEVERKIAR